MTCDDSHLCVDDQVEKLIDRLEPHRQALRDLLTELQSVKGHGSACLQIVRYFGDPAGQLDGFQHALLGWHLTTDVLQFLLDVGADIDVDEYGQDLPWYRTLRDRLTRPAKGGGPQFRLASARDLGRPREP